MRHWLRTVIPAPIRLTIAVIRRGFRDLASGDQFAAKRDWQGSRHEFGGYALPMVVYPGQESAGEAKRRNSEILASALDGSVVRPGETWSLWKLAGAPTRAKGYGEAAAIVNGDLTTTVGGATCLVSTVVFNAGLLAGLEIVERAQHSIDTYGERRYYELGRDATIEYGYLDVRFRNEFPWPLHLNVTVEDGEVHASFDGPLPRPFAVDVSVEVDRSSPDTIAARTRRTVHGGMVFARTWTAESRYRTTAPSELTPTPGAPRLQTN